MSRLNETVEEILAEDGKGVLKQAITDLQRSMTGKVSEKEQVYRIMRGGLKTFETYLNLIEKDAVTIEDLKKSAPELRNKITKIFGIVNPLMKEDVDQEEGR